MKGSFYNVFVDYDNERTILYNTRNRKYKVLTKIQAHEVAKVLGNLNRSEYTQEEAHLITELSKLEMVLPNDVNELAWIKKKENAMKEQETNYMTIFKATMDCNYRCVYCLQPHTPHRVSEEVIQGTINHLKEKAKTFKRISFLWFGGEPLLEYDVLKRITLDVSETCQEYDCTLMGRITTNGYLLNVERIKEIEKLGVKSIQITLDGDRETHDFSRPHKNGEGTFDTILENVLEVLKTDIKLILRVNVHENNMHNIINLLEKIPVEKRSRIILALSNWFQTIPKISLYGLYKEALEMGYKYPNTSNGFNVCESSYNHMVSILPTGKVVMCSEGYEDEDGFGEIQKDGSIQMTNSDVFNTFKSVSSATDRPMCIRCKELPMCMGGCMKARMKNSYNCARAVPDGLSLEEKIKIHYLNDLIHTEGVAEVNA